MDICELGENLTMLAKITDLTAKNLTEHVVNVSTENISDERTKTLISGLIKHLHDYVREVELRPGEWEIGWQYLTKVLKTSAAAIYVTKLI